MKTALVLSGGGMFGAWQAGVWRALAPYLKPDLVVGASVGALNGWAIAGGASPDELIDSWMNPDLAHFASLPEVIEGINRWLGYLEQKEEARQRRDGPDLGAEAKR